MNNRLLALNKIDEIDIFLDKLRENKEIINHKIVLQLGMRIEVNILLNDSRGKNWYFENDVFKYEGLPLKNLIKINEFENEDLTEREIELIFTKDKDLGLRRRLTNFIVPNQREIKTPCPIMTFYSYKGGVGRTTTLAYFASWLASTHDKKVVIIDCDFEAPGFTNYFDINEDKKGIVEYLLDKEYTELSGQKLDIKKDYVHDVRYEYTGKGNIYIVPAGNLGYEKDNDGNLITNHKKDYLEALARIDITSIDNIISQFESFFKDLQEQLELDYENSVILIDSRTGFNDTFAVLSTISQIIVGIFGINKQSQVGLTQFLDTFGKKTHEKDILLVKSFHNNSVAAWQSFKQIIDNHISENEDSFVDEEYGKRDFIDNIFQIKQDEILERLGTSIETVDRAINGQNGNGKTPKNIAFIDNVGDPSREFKLLFNDLLKKIDRQKEFFLVENPAIETLITEQKNEPIIDDVTNQDDNSNIDLETFLQKNRVQKDKARLDLLKKLIDENNFPKPYADNIVPQLEDFYFRDCMKDIFNRNAFIIVGYKGTGKTHIYQSFKNKKITDELCSRQKQNPNNFIFVNVIPVNEDDKKYINASSKFSSNENDDFFYERFWLLYVWSAIFENPSVKDIMNDYTLCMEHKIVNNDSDTVAWFLENTTDFNKFRAFEKDLLALDKRLKEVNKTIILSFDQLDFVIKPDNWSNGISPLINYWRNNIFSRINPKIFVRADIFENRLGNITNFNEIRQEKSIDIKWSKQELFAYFFKFIFRVDKNQFLSLVYAFKNYSDSSYKNIIDISHSLDTQSQIPITQEESLRFLVENFFGKYADRFDSKSSFGENYDWFYNNLTDAKGAISIRPFLDLIKKSIEIALRVENLRFQKEKRTLNCALQPLYFTNIEATEYAPKNYYEDLAKDKGNEVLVLFHQYIKNDGLAKFRVYEFRRELLEELIRNIISYSNYRNESAVEDYRNGRKTVNDFINLLINNGILEVTHVTQKQLTRYNMPFLYRNYFGAKKPNTKY